MLAFRYTVVAAVLATVLAAPAGAQTPSARARQQVEALSDEIMKAHRAGDYAKGLRTAERALTLARTSLGPRDRHTLVSLNNLAMMHTAQGRYDAAEPLYREALQASREVLGPRDADALSILNNLAALYQTQGRYGEAEPLFQEALQSRRETLGPRDPNTLMGLDNLATLYASQGRYGEAEPLRREALQAMREVRGPRHPDTLISLSNLAGLYVAQGRYDEAEPLLREALQAMREVRGPRHPNTLSSLAGLADLHVAQGRYGEAEPLYRDSLLARYQTLGLRHPDTLKSLNNLAGLHHLQRRYGDAELLYREVVQMRQAVLGPRHPDTLASFNSLANLYMTQGRYGEAEPLLQDALQKMREVLGPHHPVTLTSANNLAFLYKAQGRYGEAESLFRETLQQHRAVLGPRHPTTLLDLHSLAFLYNARGRYDEAEPLYWEAVQAMREVLGPRHPTTLTAQANLTMALVNQGRHLEAVRLLQQMEPQLLGWIGQELYSTAADAVRRQLVSAQSSFQDTVLSLATLSREAEAYRLAGSVMLRFKLLQGEEEAYLAQLARRSRDPLVQALAHEIRTSRAALIGAARGNAGGFELKLVALELRQQALGEVSRDYKDHLRVQQASLQDVRAALPPGAVLIEFRQFQPADFRAGILGEPHVAGLLLTGFEDPVVLDLGTVAELGQVSAELTDATAAALYQKLFAPFESKLANVTTVYLAPDGVLNLVPFARLKLADGRYWGERQPIRLLQSGRDLLRPDPDKPTRGLLALGGIDFGAAANAIGRKGKGKTVETKRRQNAAANKANKTVNAQLLAAVGADSDRAGALTRISDTFRDSFKLLPASGDEAIEIREWYQRMRKDETAQVWTGTDASKARLMALTAPPRVLHLATHGFYLPGSSTVPMLNAGVALAGANRELAGDGAGGILFALEAQGLNLDGTELVVLSACDTAKGNLDYSEGVYGLVRALRIAGARNVLVTLWPLRDGEARDFMVRFYRTWLQQPRSDPAAALRETQLSYMREDALRDPRIWAPYILVE